MSLNISENDLPVDTIRRVTKSSQRCNIDDILHILRHGTRYVQEKLAILETVLEWLVVAVLCWETYREGILEIST